MGDREASMLELQGEDGLRLGCPSWQTLSTELVQHNLRMATNIAEYWRGVAEINMATFLTLTAADDTPSRRRRKFSVIQGGK
jgi:hypothetical protein